MSDLATRSQSDFTSFWPPAGLLLGALLIARRREWPWLLGLAAVAGATAAGLEGRPAAIIAVDAAGDIGEGLLGAWLVRRLVAVRPRLGSLREALALVAVSAGAAVALPSLVGAWAFQATNPSRGLLQTWREWWTGDALGILVLAPLLLSWVGSREPFPPRRRGARVEMAALLAAVCLTAFLVFGAGGRVSLSRQYLVFPALMWAAVRFGVRGASLAAAMLAGLAAAASSEGLLRPPGLPPLGLEVQAALLVTVVATLLLAAALAEGRRALLALGERDALFGLFMRHSPAFLVLASARGRLAAMSDSLARIAGVLPAAPDGRASGRVAPLQAPAVARAGDERVLATGEPAEVEVEHAGRTLHFLKFPVPRPERPPLVGTVGLDLTEQRRAERALRLSQSALDQASDAVLFLDPDGRASYANEAAARMLGRPRAEVEGRPVWELDAGFDRAGWADRWRQLAARGSLTATGALVAADGSRHEVEAGLAYVACGDRECCVYTGRSLAERKRTEAALRLASLGTLAAGVNHEINNPLASVASNLSFAHDALEPLAIRPEVREAQAALEDAAEGARRVARVVSDLRVLSHAEARLQAEADLHLEIRAAISVARDEIRSRARLELRLDPAPRVWASPTQLGRVFLNLLLNAVHAIPEGQADRHVIRVACFTAADGRAAVEVAATGGGISPAVRHRIFEPFFTTRPFGAGVGLGLSICHGIVSGLGGQIEVESQEGLGSLFRVLLPPAASPAPRQGDPRPGGGGPGRPPPGAGPLT